MGLAPREVRTSIEQPNMPEKRDENDKTNQRKIETSIVKNGFNTNSRDDDIVYKYQWGVKIPNDDPHFRDDEKLANYVITHKWGINTMNHADVKPHTANVDRTTTTTIAVESQATNILLPAEIKEMPRNDSKVHTSDASSLVRSDGTTAIATTNDEIVIENSKPLVVSTATSDSTIVVHSNDDYNIPIETPQNEEISAWRQMVARSKFHEDIDEKSATTVKRLNDPIESIGIRSESPNPDPTLRPVSSPVAPSSNATDVNSMGSKKFHTCSTIACLTRHRIRSYGCPNGGYSSLANDDGDENDRRTVSPDIKNGAGIVNVNSPNDSVEASGDDFQRPNIDEDLTSVLQDLSQREMEVLLSYNQRNSDDTVSDCPRLLPTAVTITTFPPGATENSSKFANDDEPKNSKLGRIDESDISGSSEKILKLDDEESNEAGKDGKDKKGHKGGDYIRIPGDPYPYSREHYEKWRVPHGKCPIVNDDVPKAKPSTETSDSPCQ